MEIEREISLMGRFKFFSSHYWRLVNEKKALKVLGFEIGINIALKDLEEAGLIHSEQSEKKER